MDGENGGSSYDLPNGYGLYFAGDVAVAETAQAGNIGDDEADIAVVTAGIDHNDGSGIIFGAAFSFMQSTVDQNYGYGGTTSSDGAALSVYGDMRHGRFYANGFLSAGFHSFDTERTLLIAPNTFATAIGSTEASQFQLAAHGGFNVAKHKYTSFDLIGGIGYISVDIDGYAETGAGALSAVLAGRTMDSAIGQLGGELTLHPDNDDGQLLPVLRVIWNHEFMDDPYVISTGFAGAPATTFTTPGPDLGSDWATVGLGVKGRVSEGTSFVFRYELDVGRDGQDRQEVSAAARIAF
jgi:outer membrane autotransporter protein